MFRVTVFLSGVVQGDPGTRNHVLCETDGKTIPSTLLKAKRQLEVIREQGAAGCDVTETGALVLTAYSGGPLAAIQEARAMHQKAVRGGGR